MGGRTIRNRIYAVSGMLAFLGAIVVFDLGCGSTEPGAGKVITVTFRNSAANNIHILGPGESTIGADPPAGNRLAPNATRDWVSSQTYQAGNPVFFRAERAGLQQASVSCTLTSGQINGNPRLVVEYREVGAQSFLDCD